MCVGLRGGMRGHEGQHGVAGFAIVNHILCIIVNCVRFFLFGTIVNSASNNKDSPQ